MLRKKAQSTLEYLIILSAITGAIILFATNTFKGRVETIYENATEAMDTMSSKVGEAWQ